MHTFDEAAYWTDRYDSGKRSGQQLSHEHDFLVQEVQQRAEGCSSILDVGCGSGELALKYLKGLDQPWTGWDVSPKAIETVRQRGIGTGQVVNITGPLALGTADLVVCFNVLYHIPTEAKVQQLLENIATACSKTAMILAWNGRILERGPLGKHCFFRPMRPPPGHVVVEEKPIPGSPYKTLMVTRPFGD
jgi:SAM-dependent methyltransferase